MATSFPGALDAFNNPSPTTPLSSGTIKHSSEHSDANDAITALETKVGVGATTPLPGTALIGGSAAGSLWGRLARKNLVINGDMSISQRLLRGTSVAAVDMTYQATDRWKTLFAGGTAWNVQNFAIGSLTGSSPNFHLLQSGGNSPKGGGLYIFESIDTAPLRSLAVSLQALLVAAASIADVRWALLSWSGTADAPTDPVSAWNADGTNPTLAASWAYINTPANLGLSGGVLTLKKLENQTVPTNCNNLAIMIWCEDSVNTAGQSFYWTDVQLELGAVCTSFERIPVAQTLLLCQRYYEKSYDLDTAPGTGTAVGCMTGWSQNAIAASTAGVRYFAGGTPGFFAKKRVTPTVLIWSTDGTANCVRYGGTTNRTGCTASGTTQNTALNGLSFDATSAVAMAAATQDSWHWAASAEL